jgi:hypothetical protein
VPVVCIVSLRDLVLYLKEVGGMDKEISDIKRYWGEYGTGSLE